MSDEHVRIKARLKAAQDDVGERPYSHPVATGWYAEDVSRLLDELAGTRQALAQIEEKARWYADNGQRLAHEVDHALCVEVLSLALDGLDRSLAVSAADTTEAG